MPERPHTEDRRPRTLSAAARLLAERDRVVARLVDAYGLPRLSKPTDTLFAALVRSIVYQQLAGAAASTIHRRGPRGAAGRGHVGQQGGVGG
jgi:3-methyladenine DNA glycosylase/8-oxoguanine DNA glycosylase